MAKIMVKNAVVGLDGHEMTRIIWQRIHEKLFLPCMDISSRPATPVKARRQAAAAVRYTRKNVRATVHDRHALT